MTTLAELCAPQSAGSLELVVDLSNVCRNSSIDGLQDRARWDRIITVLQLWNSWENAFERPVTRLVADDSLRHWLTSEDRRALERAEKEGFATVVDDADPLILELAEQHNCTVLSNDNFVGHRREHPWIDGNAEQFVQVKSRAGTTWLELVTIEPRTDFSMSRAEERDELKDHRIDPDRPAHRQLLDFSYRCENPACDERGFTPEASPAMPERTKSGRLVCPNCMAELERVGRASEVMIVKLSSTDGRRSARLPLELGRSIVVGRGTSELSLKDILNHDQLKRISRNHARLSATNRGLTIEELGSTNGTKLARWRRDTETLAPGIRLTPKSAVILKPRDRAVLGNALVVERSGRRFPFDLQPLPKEQRAGRDAPRTQIATGEES